MSLAYKYLLLVVMSKYVDTLFSPYKKLSITLSIILYFFFRYRYRLIYYFFEVSNIDYSLLFFLLSISNPERHQENVYCTQNNCDDVYFDFCLIRA